MKEKIKIAIILFISIIIIIGITRELIARKPAEIDFYKKYCSKSNDVMCQQFIDL